MTTELYSELGWLRRPPADFDTQCRSLVTLAEGAGRRFKALASYALDDNQLMKLARAVSKLRGTPQALAPLHVYKLGLITNSTANFVATKHYRVSPVNAPFWMDVI